MKTKIFRFAVMVMVFSIFASLFGCGKAEKITNTTPDYPFDVEKAYCYSRSGVIAGGDFHLKLSSEGVVEYYSYPKLVSKNESGMNDKGADIYFVGLKEGTVKVTAVFEFPTTDPYEYTFTLNVAEDLMVTKID